MAVYQNKLVPVAGVVVLLVIGGILYTNFSSKPVQTAMTQIPLPTAGGADQDTPQETLATVVASNRELRADVQEVLKINEELRKRLGEAPQGSTPSAPGSGNTQSSQPAPSGNAATTPMDVIGNAWGTALDTVGGLAHKGGVLISTQK